LPKRARVGRTLTNLAALHLWGSAIIRVPGGAMKIVEFLRPEFVLADLKASNKSDALREICEFLTKRDPSLPPTQKLYDVLQEREQLRSTGIGDNVAIPHGRFGGLPQLTAAFARSINGIEFIGTDDNPGLFHHFIVVFAPENSAGLHLKALARITRLFKNAELRRAILQAPDASGIYKLIVDEDAKY
jgi:PTS system nitrogen regulatory IIA component